MYENTNNVNGLPNTIHFVVEGNKKVYCNSTDATPNNSSNVRAKVTCKRCLAALAKVATPKVSENVKEDVPEFNPALEAFDGVQDPSDNPASISEGKKDVPVNDKPVLAHVAQKVKNGEIVVKSPAKTKSASKPVNVHFFFDRSDDEPQKNGKARPNTMCSIPGQSTTEASEVTCKVCQSVMAKLTKIK